MHCGGGGGGGGRWRQDMSCAKLDAQNILDAAARARVIFPDQRGHNSPEGRSVSHHLTQTSRPKPHPHAE
jgi:pimeloyl-ACP methyl ester carboxylesterase